MPEFTYSGPSSIVGGFPSGIFAHSDVLTPGRFLDHHLSPTTPKIQSIFSQRFTVSPTACPHPFLSPFPILGLDRLLPHLDFFHHLLTLCLGFSQRFKERKCVNIFNCFVCCWMKPPPRKNLSNFVARQPFAFPPLLPPVCHHSRKPNAALGDKITAPHPKPSPLYIGSTSTPKQKLRHIGITTSAVLSFRPVLASFLLANKKASHCHFHPFSPHYWANSWATSFPTLAKHRKNQYKTHFVNTPLGGTD